MTHFGRFLLTVGIAGCFAACKKKENFDAEAQFKADTTAISAFVKANAIPALKDVKSGIFYQIITPGSGNVTYSQNTKVTVDYQGKLLKGETFDSSKGQPVTFTLGRLIAGWQIGIPFIQKGGRIRLLIPSYYGYGNEASNAIPANSILDFDITLSNVQ